MTDLTDLDNLGPARSESLEEAGYGTVDDLAEAEPEQVAEDADIPDDRALDFVVQAQNIIEDNDADAEDADSDSEEVEEDDGPTPAELTEQAQESEEDDSAEADDEAVPETLDGDEDDAPIAESYELVVDLESDIHYDVYMKALLDAYERRHGSNQDALDAINGVLDDARYNSGEVSHWLTEYELNTLHASISQQVNDYKGMNMVDHMDAMRDILQQVNEVREEELF